MHYYIDGYNLMFRVLRVGDDLSLQREKVIADLSRKAEVLQLNLTLVFDAQYQLGESSKSHYRRLEIIFSAQNQTADEYIIHELKSKKNPLQFTVVTSDKKLAWLARRQAAKTETVEEFLNWLGKRYENKGRLKKIPIEKKVVKKTPLPKKSTEKISPEDSFNYYLETFQKALAAEPPSRSQEKTPLKIESDFSRWERLFKEKLERESITDNGV